MKENDKTTDKTIDMSNKMDKVTNNLDNINITQNMELIKEWATYILDSDLRPKYLKTTQDLVNAILLGRELGFTPLISINNIFPIDNKPTIGLNLYTALAFKNNTTFDIIKDFEPEYLNYDDKGNSYDIEYLNENKEIFFRVPFSHDKIPTGFNKPENKVLVYKTSKPTDYVTEIHFTRKFNDGRIIKLKHTFKFSEASTMGLTTKSNWIKMPRIMLKARCLTGGIRLIGGDYINGIMETNELAESLNYKFAEAECID